ncbi:hypothetical protein E4U21_002182 [Claviceps maximensis]|nr:hypothetical protein E4U21_002182 [Claviceps maximensis]
MKSIAVLALAAAAALAQSDVSAPVEETGSPTETAIDNVTVTGSLLLSTSEAASGTPATSGSETVIASVSASAVTASTISVPLTMTTEASWPSGVLPTNGTGPVSTGTATIKAGAAVHGVAVSGVLGGILAALVALA